MPLRRSNFVPNPVSTGGVSAESAGPMGTGGASGGAWTVRADEDSSSVSASPRSTAISRAQSTTWAPMRAVTAALFAGLLGWSSLGCNGGGSVSPGDARSGSPRSQAGADDYVRTAIRKSSEGVVFFPSESAGREYDPTRLNEIAQALRRPMALCFLTRAIETMQPAEVDGEATFTGVPEGQIKMRARIANDGKVLLTEILDSGFTDEWMESCLQKAVEDKRFPQTKTGYNKHIDVVYWVSLGFFASAQSGTFEDHLRREQVRAGQRAKRCLEGRIAPGEYEVHGLSLFDREGQTLAHRLDGQGLPTAAVQCLDSAVKTIEIPREPDAFVRPVMPVLAFSVAENGAIAVRDAKWLELIELEERAQREAKRRELTGASGEPIDGPIVPTAPGAGGPAYADPRNQPVDSASSENAESEGESDGDPDADSGAGEDGRAPGALQLRPR